MTDWEDLGLPSVIGVVNEVRFRLEITPEIAAMLNNMGKLLLNL